MAIRKNKKFIDPRYFLHETAYRDLNENPEVDKRIEQISALIAQNEQSAERPVPEHWNGVPRANAAQGPYELMVVTNLEKDDQNAAAAQKALRKQTAHMKNTLVGFDRAGRLSLVTGNPDWQSVDDMISLAAAIVQDILPSINAGLSYYRIRYNMGGLPCRREAPAGYPKWITGVNQQGQVIDHGYTLTLVDTDSSGKPNRNEELIKAALLNAETEKMCKG